MSILHEEATLELLRADLEESGPGVTAEALCAGAGCWSVKGVFRAVRGLRRRGCVVEELDGPRFKLWSEPAASTESPGADGCGSAPPAAALAEARPGGSVGAEQLRLGVAA